MLRGSIRAAVLIIGSGLTVWAPAALPAQSQTPPAEEEPTRLAVPRNYRYNPRGRRDPFINPVPVPIEKPLSPAAAAILLRPPGLKGVLLSEAAIAGVVTSRDPSMTLVVIGGAGGNRYFARVGDALYDAVVREITIDAVTFVLTELVGNEKTRREIVRPVRPPSGEYK